MNKKFITYVMTVIIVAVMLSMTVLRTYAQGEPVLNSVQVVDDLHLNLTFNMTTWNNNVAIDNSDIEVKRTAGAAVVSNPGGSGRKGRHQRHCQPCEKGRPWWHRNQGQVGRQGLRQPDGEEQDADGVHPPACHAH